MSNIQRKDYTNRTSCSSHNECLETEYCDQFGYCWWCYEYDVWCDSYTGECPQNCFNHGMMGDCPECQNTTLMGDVNYDGEVNIIDVVQIVSWIMGNGNYDEDQFYAADVNQDGVLNVMDVVAIIDSIMSRGAMSETQARNILNQVRYRVRRFPKIRRRRR